jgi:hypothetical protein
LAFIAFSAASLAVVWKTVGVGFIPGFNELWGSPRYPRQGSNDSWDLFYLIMYGGLGVVGQWNGLRLTTDTANRRNNQVTRRRAAMLGVFHVVIACHHVAWALIKDWGRLDLDRFNIRGGYVLEGVVGLLTGYHGLRLVMGNETDRFQDIVRHKTFVGSTFLSLIPMPMFLPAQWMDYESFQYEKYTWIATMGIPSTMFAADIICEARSKNKVKKN